jgi:hypothetical protein
MGLTLPFSHFILLYTLMDSEESLTNFYAGTAEPICIALAEPVASVILYKIFLSYF